MSAYQPTLIARPLYLDVLLGYIDVPLVKILAGIRRCGKSTILEMFKHALIESGVESEHIITRRYTSLDIPETFTVRDMYEDLKQAMHPGGRYYLLLDELQEVEGWEKAVNSLFEEGRADIYITGSNSRLMADEISTYLTGRYVQIPVYTLSYSEYLDFKKYSTRSERNSLTEYLRFGGFPIIAAGTFTEQTAYQIVEGIYHSIITGDIARRHAIGSQDLFDRTVRFIVENVGKTFSANSIVTFLKSEKRSLSVESIYNYISYLEKAFVIYRCRRYDLQGKSILKTQEKFYLADPSLKYCILGFNPKGLAAMLENVVYLELRRRGYDVYIGKLGDKEIDFVAKRRDERLYVQVCRNLPEASDREIANLLAVKDHYPKLVVTLDNLAGGTIEGVRLVHLEDFLLSRLYSSALPDLR
ncbi:MAG: ATP-binding protein [Sphaerochaeta sp.]|jgi:predicted AAA+ superfamily ATPase|uniref:AAA domain-containing protein n=1 Tax=bioreactor metagenome TaxID=1076179 RepID=A0A645CSB6_9ZZZZ|nr:MULTISPECIES: ATP-binding protein [Sphaerochaeta]MDD2394587.1 ATP-binding protein [Sphaerochaeta sp.]MDD4039042.1 ATP-binding protein [Sphaerochaeta sp.]MDD4449348.1 ATP-binding protein [Sphaerochaeta sp.]MDX9983295.1 ATP-binding protein [Sphaerochaeta sp.]MEA5107278.1 ATP-binding protein [Sphaerochaeta associata]